MGHKINYGSGLGLPLVFVSLSVAKVSGLTGVNAGLPSSINTNPSLMKYHNTKGEKLATFHENYNLVRRLDGGN